MLASSPGDERPFRRLLAIKCAPDDGAAQIVTSLVDFDVRERFYPSPAGLANVNKIEPRPSE